MVSIDIDIRLKRRAPLKAKTAGRRSGAGENGSENQNRPRNHGMRKEAKSSSGVKAVWLLPAKAQASCAAWPIVELIFLWLQASLSERECDRNTSAVACNDVAAEEGVQHVMASCKSSALGHVKTEKRGIGWLP